MNKESKDVSKVMRVPYAVLPEVLEIIDKHNIEMKTLKTSLKTRVHAMLSKVVTIKLAEGAEGEIYQIDESAVLPVISNRVVNYVGDIKVPIFNYKNKLSTVTAYDCGTALYISNAAAAKLRKK